MWVKGLWNDWLFSLASPGALQFRAERIKIPPTRYSRSSGSDKGTVQYREMHPPTRHFCASKQPAFLSPLLQALFHIQSVAAQLLQCPLSIWTYRLSPAANRMAPFPHSPGHQSAPRQLVTGGGMGKPGRALLCILSSHHSAGLDMFSSICLLHCN